MADRREVLCLCLEICTRNEEAFLSDALARGSFLWHRVVAAAAAAAVGSDSFIVRFVY